MAMHLRRFMAGMTRERATLPRTCRVANMVTTAVLRKRYEGFRREGSVWTNLLLDYRGWRRGGKKIRRETQWVSRNKLR